MQFSLTIRHDTGIDKPVKAKQTSPQPRDLPQEDVMAVDPTEPFRRAGETLKRAGAEARDNGHTISMKLIEHAESNTRQAFAKMREMAAAGNVGDVVKIQAEFVREQGSRAVEQARELGELIAQFGKNAIATATEKPKE